MFAYIKGTLENKANNYIIIETGSIGYKIFMSSKAIEKIGELSSNVKVYTYYYVREDNISLYGFNTNEELKMFELLLSVSGIGAKSAIAMLSAIEPSSFALAIISNDTSQIVKIPGIGAKTAARIILELKDKIKTEETIQKTDEVINAVNDDNKNKEIIEALQVLGYGKREIMNSLEKIDIKTLEIEEIIKTALKYLSK